MMTIQEAREEIEKETARARTAAEEGNDGMVRVCARRASGIAIRYWLQQHPRMEWGNDALNQLKNVQLDQSAPLAVRVAARRLLTRVSERLVQPDQQDPLEDCNTIVEFFLGEE
jgi:hypothetical protein